MAEITTILTSLIGMIWFVSGIYFYFFVLDKELEKENTFAVFIVFLIITPPFMFWKYITGEI